MFDEPPKEVKKKPAIMFQSSVPLKVPELKDKRHSVNSFMLMYKPKERPDTRIRFEELPLMQDLPE